MDSGITGTVKNYMLDKGCQRNDLNESGGHESKQGEWLCNWNETTANTCK
jgi:hypothetical protein